MTDIKVGTRVKISSIDEVKRWEIRDFDDMRIILRNKWNVQLQNVSPFCLQEPDISLWAVIEGDIATVPKQLKNQVRYVRFDHSDRITPFRFTDDNSPYERSAFAEFNGPIFAVYDYSYPFNPPTLREKFRKKLAEVKWIVKGLMPDSIRSLLTKAKNDSPTN